MIKKISSATFKKMSIHICTDIIGGSKTEGIRNAKPNLLTNEEK